MNAKRNSNLKLKLVESEAKAEAPKEERFERVLLLKGYTPRNATPLSIGQVPVRKIGLGQFEYEDVPGTLEKRERGEEVDLPETEARSLIRKGLACYLDMATEAQLIQAGIKRPEPKEDEYLD